jgi:hypothetical protein
MEKLHTYNINWELVAQGLGLPIDKTLDLFDDGRIMGRVGEFLHQNSEMGVRENENSSFDVLDVNNIRSEIRTITDKVSFASSKEIGYGRTVTEEGFKQKLDSVDRFILIDKRSINEGKIQTISLTKNDVENLPLGKKKSISSKKFFEIYDRDK